MTQPLPMRPLGQMETRTWSETNSTVRKKKKKRKEEGGRRKEEGGGRRAKQNKTKQKG